MLEKNQQPSKGEYMAPNTNAERTQTPAEIRRIDYLVSNNIELIERRTDTNGHQQLTIMAAAQRAREFQTLNQAQAYLDDNHEDMQKPWEGLKAA
jgi:hypothetical protein